MYRSHSLQSTILKIKKLCNLHREQEHKTYIIYRFNTIIIEKLK